MTEPWAAAITKPLAEEAAEAALRRRGWRVYLPRYRKLLRPHGSQRKPEPVLRPLFPRYLFVALRPQWSGIINVPGVLALVGGIFVDHWEPYTLTEDVIETIREAENAGEWDEVERKTERRRDLPLGATVSVPELGGALAKLLHLDDEGRAKVLIEILGRTVTPQVRADGLALARVA